MARGRAGRFPTRSSARGRTRAESIRAYLRPLAAIFLGLSLLLVPPSGRKSIAQLLEWSLFWPFRAAVGWGPRSLETQREVARLQEERVRAVSRSDQALEAEAENDRLRGLLGFQRRGAAELLAAEVIGRGRSRPDETLLIRPEAPERAAVGQPVVTPEGLLGRISSVSGGTARVEALRHRNVVVSVIDQRSREEGILRWDPEQGSLLAVQGVSAQADWQVGDRIVTSGMGAVFPKGLLVGWVVGTRPEGTGLLRRILVRPAAGLRSAEEVFLLLSPDGITRNPDAESAYFPTDPGAALSRLDWGDRASFEPSPAP